MPRTALEALDDQPFDVIVIGAGINGAASAQHLAAAGYRVLLVDKGDFGSGSSSRSTRVLHCGLRYFETPRPVLDFLKAPGKLAVAVRMAKSAMEMRGELVKDTGKRLRATRIMFPIFKDGPYRAWQLDLAFRILGQFGPAEAPLDYERIPAARAASLPFISALRDPQRLHSVGVFTEYMYDWPERILMDVVLDAERLGATVRNYTRAAIGARDADGLWSVALSDVLDPATVTVRAPIILNMAGIWIDQVNATATPDAGRLIFGTKGAHLVVKFPDDWRDYGIATTNRIGEPHYIVPSQGGHHTIGPTETVYEGDLDDITVNREDRDFLLEETTRIFPGLDLDAERIVYTWAGVRPLGFDGQYPKGKRALEIHDLEDRQMPGVYAMTAGPIMTHRSAAREVVATVRNTLPPSGTPQPPNYTPRAFPDNPNSPPLVDGDPSIRLSDLAHAAVAEHGVSLSDILIARTGTVYRHRLSGEDVRRAAEALSTHLGWTQEKTEQQIRAHNERLRRIYQVVE